MFTFGYVASFVVLYLSPIMRSERFNFEHLLVDPSWSSTFRSLLWGLCWLLQPEKMKRKALNWHFLFKRSTKGLQLREEEVWQKDGSGNEAFETKHAKQKVALGGKFCKDIRQLMTGYWLTSTYSFKFKLKFGMLCLFYKYLSKGRDISKQCLIRKFEHEPREV